MDLDFIVSSFVFISNWKVRFFLVVKTVSVKIIFYFEKGSYKNYVVLTFTDLWPELENFDKIQCAGSPRTGLKK